jgi:hypothetical protein
MVWSLVAKKGLDEQAGCVVLRLTVRYKIKTLSVYLDNVSDETWIDINLLYKFLFLFSSDKYNKPVLVDDDNL